MAIETQDGYISNLLLFNKTAEVVQKKPKCPLSGKNAPVIDYKNVEVLKLYITKGRGRILPRRITGVSSKKQRQLAKAIKIARILGLLPFSSAA
jgi:small subunit ribosomal protein S18